MHKVLIYRDTSNLGDAIQTYALCRLLGRGKSYGVYRDGPHSPARPGVPFFVNGWLGWSVPPSTGHCIFAGVHVGENEGRFVRWIRDGTAPAGARDSYTAGLLGCAGIEAANIGCATLTLDAYRGPRKGRYSVDIGPVKGTEALTQKIGRISWRKQWELAVRRLDQLRTAEIVYTSRLHVALPCLAFQTPVCFPLAGLEGTFQKQRLILLSDLGVPFDTVVVMDVRAAAERFHGFLESAKGSRVRVAREVVMPEPL